MENIKEVFAEYMRGNIIRILRCVGGQAGVESPLERYALIQRGYVEKEVLERLACELSLFTADEIRAIYADAWKSLDIACSAEHASAFDTVTARRL